MGIGITVTVDARELKARLEGLRGTKLRSKARRSISASLRRSVVPALRANVPNRYGGHSGKYGTRGTNKRGKKYNPTKGELARKVSVRFIRTRSGEVGAWSVKSRAWFAHMVSQGTNPHVIRVSDRFGRASNRIVRQINEGKASPAALYFNNAWVERVEHPGAKPNPWVRLTVTDSLRAEVATQLGKDLMKER